MKKFKPETYIIIRGIAHNVDRMPWYKRWSIKIKNRLGIQINDI